MTKKNAESAEHSQKLEEQVDAVFHQLSGALPADQSEQRVHKNAMDRLKEAKNAVKAWDDVIEKRKPKEE